MGTTTYLYKDNSPPGPSERDAGRNGKTARYPVQKTTASMSSSTVPSSNTIPEAVKPHRWVFITSPPCKIRPGRSSLINTPPSKNLCGKRCWWIISRVVHDPLPSPTGRTSQKCSSQSTARITFCWASARIVCGHISGSKLSLTPSLSAFWGEGFSGCWWTCWWLSCPGEDPHSTSYPPPRTPSVC